MFFEGRSKGERECVRESERVRKEGDEERGHSFEREKRAH